MKELKPNIAKEEKINGLLPSCWGPPAWFFIHSVAYSYNPSKKDAYYIFFKNLGNILPCQECKQHYYENFNEADLTYALESNEAMFRWSYDLHNKVNIKLGKTDIPNFQNVLDKYNGYKSNCSNSCQNGSTKKIKIIENFENNQEKNNLEILVYILIFIIAVLVIILIFSYRGFFKS